MADKIEKTMEQDKASGWPMKIAYKIWACLERFDPEKRNWTVTEIINACTIEVENPDIPADARPYATVAEITKIKISERTGPERGAPFFGRGVKDGDRLAYTRQQVEEQRRKFFAPTSYTAKKKPKTDVAPDSGNAAASSAAPTTATKKLKTADGANGASSFGGNFIDLCNDTANNSNSNNNNDKILDLTPSKPGAVSAVSPGTSSNSLGDGFNPPLAADNSERWIFYFRVSEVDAESDQWVQQQVSRGIFSVDGFGIFMDPAIPLSKNAATVLDVHRVCKLLNRAILNCPLTPESISSFRRFWNLRSEAGDGANALRVWSVALGTNEWSYHTCGSTLHLVIPVSVSNSIRFGLTRKRLMKMKFGSREVDVVIEGALVKDAFKASAWGTESPTQYRFVSGAPLIPFEDGQAALGSATFIEFNDDVLVRKRFMKMKFGAREVDVEFEGDLVIDAFNASPWADTINPTQYRLVSGLLLLFEEGQAALEEAKFIEFLDDVVEEDSQDIALSKQWAPHIESKMFYKPQAQVAYSLFDKITARVELKGFEKMRFAIITAGYASLREQTTKRMEDCGLAGPCFISNPHAVANVVAFLECVLKEEKTLFVMICDEAHWGINKGGAYEKMINGVSVLGLSESLRDAPNFVQLCVSATPYNLLSTVSRIPDQNVVRWIDCKNVSVQGFADGKTYVGLNELLTTLSGDKGDNRNAKFRIDKRFEDSQITDNVLALAVEYLIAIAKRHALDGQSSNNTIERWGDALSAIEKQCSKECYKAFLQELKPHKLGECVTLKELQDAGETETDKIISHLLDVQCAHMVVVRIAPGSDSDSEKGLGKLAKSKFLNPVTAVLKALKMHSFAVLGDFGDQKPQTMLNRPMYSSLWAQMQRGDCSSKECACSVFEPKPNGTCKSCNHIHRPFKSYSDLDGIPILLVIVMKGRLGDTFPSSFSTFDMRATKHTMSGVQVSSLVQELGRMCSHREKVENSPLALVSGALLKTLSSAKGDYLNLDLGIDNYLIDKDEKKKKLTARMMTPPNLAKPVPADKSMDFGNKDKWNQRFLLWAEPQVGKTGAFLLLLRLLETSISLKEVEEMIPEPEPLPPIAAKSLWPYWFYPNAAALSEKMRPYNQLQKGKYHVTVAKLRVQAKNASTTVEDFQKKIRTLEGPLSKAGRAMLSAIQSSNIDWDGFLHRERSSGSGSWDEATINREANQKFAPKRSHPLVPKEREPRLIDRLYARNSLDRTGKQDVIDKTSRRIDNFLLTKSVDKVAASDSLEITPLRVSMSLPVVTGEFFTNSVDGQLKLIEDWSIARKRVRFVLTPSHRLRNSEWLQHVSGAPEAVQSVLAFPDECRLNYADVLEKQYDGVIKTIQVVFVREEFYENYVGQWGHNCIICKLPPVLYYRHCPAYHFTNDSEPSRFTAEHGGVGFSRLVAQLWAYQLGIDQCHMWDDNVTQCMEMAFDSDGKLAPHVVSFSRIFTQMEAIMYGDEKILDKENPVQPGQGICKALSSPSLAAYAGGKPLTETVGILGMGRAGERKLNKVHPFKKTPVYSAVMLNVKATVENNALFPCKRIWEDVEFAYVLDSVNLAALKIQRLYHAKAFNRLRRELHPGPENQFVRWPLDVNTKLTLEDRDVEPAMGDTLVTYCSNMIRESPDTDFAVCMTSDGNCDFNLPDGVKVEYGAPSESVFPKVVRLMAPNLKYSKLLGLQEGILLLRDAALRQVPHFTLIVPFLCMRLEGPPQWKKWIDHPILDTFKGHVEEDQQTFAGYSLSCECSLKPTNNAIPWARDGHALIFTLEHTNNSDASDGSNSIDATGKRDRMNKSNSSSISTDTKKKAKKDDV